jgi:hypothetical protein
VEHYGCEQVASFGDGGASPGVGSVLNILEIAGLFISYTIFITNNTRNTPSSHMHPTHPYTLYVHTHTHFLYTPTSTRRPTSLRTIPTHVPVPHIPKPGLGPDWNALDARTDHQHHSDRSASLSEQRCTQVPGDIRTASLSERADPMQSIGSVYFPF